MAKALATVAGAAALATASWSSYVKYLEISDFKEKRILNPQGRLFFISRSKRVLPCSPAVLQSCALMRIYACFWQYQRPNYGFTRDR